MVGNFLQERYKIPLLVMLLGLLLLGFDMGTSGLLSSGGFPAILVGILLVVLGGIGILLIKLRDIGWQIPRRIQDYFTKYAIISIISAIIGLLIYLIVTPPSFYEGFYLFYDSGDSSKFLFIFIGNPFFHSSSGI